MDASKTLHRAAMKLRIEAQVILLMVRELTKEIEATGELENLQDERLPGALENVFVRDIMLETEKQLQAIAARLENAAKIPGALGLIETEDSKVLGLKASSGLSDGEMISLIPGGTEALILALMKAKNGGRCDCRTCTAAREKNETPAVH